MDTLRPKDIKVPEDLGLKVADNPEQAFWIRVKEKAEEDILGNQRSIIINEAIKDLALKKIEVE